MCEELLKEERKAMFWKETSCHFLVRDRTHTIILAETSAALVGYNFHTLISI